MINFVNILYIGTGSVTIACLISMVICKIVIKNLAEFLLKRNVSRNTLIDDRFFKWLFLCKFNINNIWYLLILYISMTEDSFNINLA